MLVLEHGGCQEAVLSELGSEALLGLQEMLAWDQTTRVPQICCWRCSTDGPAGDAGTGPEQHGCLRSAVGAAALMGL